MTGFRDDILMFLKESGFHCYDEVREDFCQDAIHIKEPDRWIIPIRISATSPEEATEISEIFRNGIMNAGVGSPVIITEDWWRHNPAMMRQRLLSHLGRHFQIFARNCEVRRIDKVTAGEFLRSTHSYGDAACRYRYGLFLKRHTGHVAAELDSEKAPAVGTLVAVATFSNARKWIKADKTIRSYEWTRYASLPGVRVIGGMGKILKTFIKEVQPDDIMSYADMEWSEGRVYEQLGFVHEGEKEPVSFLIDTSTWERSVIKRSKEMAPVDTRALFYRNFGSAKYRLKLTDYE